MLSILVAMNTKNTTDETDCAPCIKNGKKCNPDHCSITDMKKSEEKSECTKGPSMDTLMSLKGTSSITNVG